MSFSYIDQMDRISNDELLEGLAGYGLFADKIPPFLTAENFFNFAQNNQHGGNSKFQKQDFVTDFIAYESIRNINIPRGLAIPNPISYFNLCKCLADNWDKLKAHFKANTEYENFKISRIHIRKIIGKRIIFEMGEYHKSTPRKIESFDKKELFEMSFKNHEEDDSPIPKILIGKRFVVNADISNCFGSIYTHALSWALVGKDIAKKERNGYWHNDIDKYTMNINNGETHGILIGCHASNLLSEIILVVVDEKMRSLGYQYIRNIDDYTCYAETFEKSEQFLIDLSSELKEFGLSLNHKKTKIDNLPLAVSAHWIRKLSLIKTHKFINFISIQQFIDATIELMADNHDNAAIMNYAMKILSKKKISKSALKYYVDIIHHLVLIYPYLVQLLEKQLFDIYKISTDEIKKISNSIYEYGINRNLNELVSYSIYFSIRYGFSLSENLYDYAEKSNDCIVILLSFLHDKRACRKITDSKMKKYKKLADKLYDKGDGMDKFWLFIYEIFTHGKFPNGSDWREMKQNNISFIENGFADFQTMPQPQQA